MTIASTAPAVAYQAGLHGEPAGVATQGVIVHK
jgi:hypothetical protein